MAGATKARPQRPAQPRARFRGEKPKRAPLRLLALPVVVLLVVAGVVFALTRSDDGTSSTPGAKEQEKNTAENLAPSLASPIDIQMEAVNALDGGNLGDLASAEALADKVRPLLAQIDTGLTPEGRPQPRSGPATRPPGFGAIDDSVPCARTARGHEGAAVAVYLAGVRYKGTEAVVLGFVSKAPRPVHLFVFGAAKCDLLLRTAIS